jgi:hypothetical protein
VNRQNQFERDYYSDEQVRMRHEPGAACCIDEDCDLSGGAAHVGPCEPCSCGKEHAIAECPGVRVYIAGGSSERLTVCRPLIERAIEFGVDVTADWTRDPGWDLGRMPHAEEFRESAERDLDAIRRADVVWLVVPAQKSEGAAAEIGFALGLGKRLVVSGEIGARNIFALCASPGDTFDRHENALAHVVELSRRRETVSP